MDDEPKDPLRQLWSEIRAANTRAMDLALRQALLDGLGKSSEDIDQELVSVEDDLIKMRASRDLAVFRLRKAPSETASEHAPAEGR